MSRSAVIAAGALLAGLFLTGCGQEPKEDESATAPPQTEVVEQPDLNVVKVARPERFDLVKALERSDYPELRVTGTVNPDVELSVPVVSLASGRVVGLYAKLGDDVRKGQLLLKILSTDVSNSFQSLDQAKADQELARKQLERAKLLYEHGAMSLNDLQVAEDAERKSTVAVNAAEQQVRTLGADSGHRDPVVNIVAPQSGTIVEQNIFPAASVHTPDNQPNLFTIANLSKVWILCDVYENDLPSVHVGDIAEVRLNAYPDQSFRGRVSNIGKVLDPNIRTAKVRIELANPGIMRTGMFVTATFRGQHGKTYATLPSQAVLHLHDRDWVFVPIENGQFRRVEITTGRSVGGQLDVVAGITAGQQVVANPLALNSESEQ